MEQTDRRKRSKMGEDKKDISSGRKQTEDQKTPKGGEPIDQRSNPNTGPSHT